VVCIVVFVHILRKKKLHIVLDVSTARDTHSGGSVNYTLVQLNMKLSTVVSAQIFHVISLWDILREHLIV